VSLSTPRDIHAARRVVANTTNDANVQVASLVATNDLKLLGVHVFGTTRPNWCTSDRPGNGLWRHHRVSGGCGAHLPDTFAEAYKVAALDMMDKMRTLSQFRAWCRWRHRSRTQTDDISP
jgi:hypothetical protein